MTHVVQFGGQGAHWLAELREIRRSGCKTVNDALVSVAALFQRHAAKHEDVYTFGFDVLQWLDGTAVPAASYLSYAPISYPWIGKAEFNTITHRINIHSMCEASVLFLTQAHPGITQLLNFQNLAE